jgi:pyruvate formate-lyase/glycerol dehydratase family glycyl radical enzyme
VSDRIGERTAERAGHLTPRVERLRAASLAAVPSLSDERALAMTRFYRDSLGKHSAPVMRALAFRRLCETKTIRIGPDELIVGDRGPAPKATPTFPELTCHSLEDLRILDSREKTRYAVAPGMVEAYEREVIPYWRGRSLRDRIWAALPTEWHAAYDAGIFTEFMEQRAPGHTVADGKIYRRGLLDFKADIAAARAALDPADLAEDPTAPRRLEQWRAMEIAADAAILFAARHAALAREMAAAEADSARRDELLHIADVCDRVPAHAPRDFHEALQMYWFCHLAVITELNGWDSFSPGHLDQHLTPFYERGLADGSLTREHARELLCAFFVKFNDHLAPPKVGVTAAESSTYTDFANINLGGLQRDGTDGTSEVSYLLLEVVEDLHLVQPSNNVQISIRTPERFLQAACQVIRRGYGYPSVFNADGVVTQLVRMGKSVEDAREGGNSGCVETGAFGKEAYILTGYFNLPKVLELALNDGVDPLTAKRLGPATGDPRTFESFDRVFDAWRTQMRHFVEIKLRGNALIERMYADDMPAPFLSLITDDCIARGLDYNAGGARYNASFIQGVGIGTLTDSLAAIRKQVFVERSVSMAELLAALAGDFEGTDLVRALLRNRSPKWGNDDAAADDLMRAAFEAYVEAIDGRPNGRGGAYGVDMLPTTCHIYFGSMTGATPDGRFAGTPLSEGISPVQGMDRLGPTAVLRSAGKMDQARTCGTLLNMKLSPGLVEGEEGIVKLASLIRTYFRLGGHHIQFNVVKAETLRDAQEHPDAHRDLIVRVAGYSDYFCDLSRSLQDEIISRTEQQTT